MSAITRAGAAGLIACVVAGCHGGGDGSSTSSGGGAQQVNVSPANVAFTAAAPGSPLPPAQSVLVTLIPNSGQLFFRPVVTGTAVGSIDNITMQGPTQARITIRPALPSVLGVGRHVGVITVLVCNTDVSCSGQQVAGSPVTINVAYQVGTVAPPPESLAPSVGAAGVPGDVVLRGTGFTPVTSVSFGATPAISFTVMSDSEIRASYPALLSGTLGISLNGGGVPFGQSLTLVPAGTLAAATLTYPALPQNMRGLAFDAVNQALFVGSGSVTPTNNQVLRFAFVAGAWQGSPLQPSATVPNLRNLTLSLDGTRLLALTDTTVTELDPATLATLATRPRTTDGSTTSDSFLKGIVATNDGQAFIVSSSGSFGEDWLYAVAARTFSVPLATFTFPEIGGPDNGTRAVLVQSGVTQAVQQYNAFTGLVSPTSLVLAHLHPVADRAENINLPAFDRNGNHMLVAGVSGGGTVHAVYDANFDELGRVPSSELLAGNIVNTAAYAISPDGTRAYILQIGTSVCRVRAFDLTAPPGPGAQFPEVVVTGFPINLSANNLSPNCPASGFDTPIRILLNPPGDTLFIAGSQSIRVVRVP
jgi:hypothetical protein